MTINRIFIKVLSLFDKFRNRAYQKSFISGLKSSGKNFNIEYPFDFLNADCVSIGDNFIARRHLKIRAFKEFSGDKFEPEIWIGDSVHFATDCYVAAIGKIRIGNHAAIGAGVTIIDHAHGNSDYSDIETPVMSRSLSSKGPIIIGENVWIGDHAVILAGVTIGKNSIIGANAVVTKDIPEYSIAVGIPARVIKQLK